MNDQPNLVTASTEGFKAVQEASKAAQQGIGLFDRICEGLLAELSGLGADHVHMLRCELGMKWFSKFQAKFKDSGLEDNFRVIPPKFLVGIIENATLEPDDDMQQLWANLLVSAVDPDFLDTGRMAFIDILKQLEIVDVHVLSWIYEAFVCFCTSYKKRLSQAQPLKSSQRSDFSRLVSPMFYFEPWTQTHSLYWGSCEEEDYVFTKSGRIQYRDLPSNRERYIVSLDNLMRLRLTSSYKEGFDGRSHEGPFGDFRATFDCEYDKVCLTQLGVAFMEACTRARLDDLDTETTG
jgi:hypothetical protein